MRGHLTREEVAEILNVSERTVSRRVREGKIVVRRKGNRVYFPKEQFEVIEESEGEEDNPPQVLDILQKQLKVKDKQIEKLQRQLEAQGELVRNEQVISKGLQDKFLMITEPETRTETQKPEQKPEEKRESSRKKKKKVKKETPKKKSKTKRKTKKRKEISSEESSNS